MAAVSVLTAVPLDLGKLAKTLARAGYHMARGGRGYVIMREGRSMTVENATGDLPRMPDRVIRSVTELLGVPPRFRAACCFDDTTEDPYEWAMLVHFAQAVARRVPLAVLVLDDRAGATYLVHPEKGLVGPEEYQAMQRRNPVADVLRRFLGESG